MAQLPVSRETRVAPGGAIPTAPLAIATAMAEGATQVKQEPRSAHCVRQARVRKGPKRAIAWGLVMAVTSSAPDRRRIIGTDTRVEIIVRIGLWALVRREDRTHWWVLRAWLAGERSLGGGIAPRRGSSPPPPASAGADAARSFSNVVPFAPPAAHREGRP